MRLAFRWLACLALGSGPAMAQSSTGAVTLNLHGHHPMHQETRYFEYRDGRVDKASPDLFYFRLDEIERGEALRQEKLSEILSNLSPDFVALQEVVAGKPGEPLDCSTFERPGPADSLGTNVALRLAQAKRLAGRYGVALACRGNAGWITGPDIFRDRRIVTLKDQGQGQLPRREVIFDFGEAPYPQGMVVEGFAILHGMDWQVQRNELRTLRVGVNEELFSYQGAAFEHADGRRILVANLHAGHKIRHFEQAVELRIDLERVRRELGWPQSVPLLVLGDFNEPLELPGLGTNWLMLPWHLKREGRFDWTGPSWQRLPSPSDVAGRLSEIAADPDYKSWANVGDARARIDSALGKLGRFLSSAGGECESRSGACLGEPVVDFALKEAFDSCEGRCTVAESGVGGDIPGRIDFIFVPNSVPIWDRGLMGRNSWDTLDFVSDHPLIWAELGLY